jgi:tetratricopeptide (TPR) repeat protein
MPFKVFPQIILLVLTVAPQPASSQAVQQGAKAEAHLLRSLAYLDKDRYEEAIKEINQAIAENPKSAEARYQLGLAQWKLGRPVEASASFVRALQLAPNHALAHYYLGRTFLQAQNMLKAVESFEKAIQLGNGKPVVDEYFQLGKTYLTLKKPADAIRILEAGAKVQPRDDRLYAQLGKAYLSLRRRPEAETALARSKELRDYQREATSRLLQGSEFLKAGEVEKALPIYQWFLNSEDTDDLVSLGIQFGQHGLHEPATQLLTKALSLSRDLFEAQYNLGLIFFRAGKEEQAEAHLTAAAALRPYSFEASSILGVALSQRGKTGEAIKALQRAEILKPDDLKVATLLALQLTEGRYYTEAVRLLDRFVKRWPDNLDLRLLLIQNYHRDQKYEKAVQAAGQTVALFPNAARANFEMGYQLLSFGRAQQAKSFLEKAVQLDPAPPDGYVSLGEVHSKEDNHTEAIRHFRLALERDPANMDAALGLAKSLLTLKRYSEVVAEMQRVIPLDPANPQPHFHLSQAFQFLGDMQKAQQAAKTFRQLNQQRMERRDQEGGRELSDAQSFDDK